MVDGVTTRVLSYNIRFGGERRVDLIGSVIAAIDPDIVVLQEAYDPDAVSRIAEVTGLAPVASRPGRSVVALVRTPPRSARWHPTRGRRGVLELDVAPNLRIVGLHLPAGLSRRGERERLADLDAILPLVGPPDDGRTLLVGDFNAVGQGDAPHVARLPMWLRILLRVDGGIRTEVMDRLTQAGWVDVFRRLHPHETGDTLPAAAPAVRLDYVLGSRAMAARVAACTPVSEAGDLPTAVASDHLPLLAVIDPPPGASVRPPFGAGRSG